ncbi:MAG: AmmeMemoRadiSam system radical SAM enzyme [Candidatus Thermoplasmatota archaeon]|nr:AmmeMemoRadiSam system radical SAM enzyme [Candidatus Thermoplasmatota archaeon]
MKDRTAQNWVSRANGDVECHLCPHRCRIKEGGYGLCGIRTNESGELKAKAYGIYPAVHLDPIEKKPLNHFLPGSSILSLGSVGCNMTCLHCQNFSLARERAAGMEGYFISPGKLVEMAGKSDSVGVAFTYNEPTINHEYLMDVCPMLRESRSRTVMVTNGYLSPEPWNELMEHTDGANIDVKGFSEAFYREVTGGRLAPVIENVRSALDIGVHIEIAYLVIPGRNDDDVQIEGFIDWVMNKLGEDVPVHFNRFHPDYKMVDVPPTSRGSLESIRDKAVGGGIKFVYIGNMGGKDYNTTFCPSCKRPVITRDHFLSSSKGISDGKCRKCG